MESRISAGVSESYMKGAHSYLDRFSKQVRMPIADVTVEFVEDFLRKQISLGPVTKNNVRRTLRIVRIGPATGPQPKAKVEAGATGTALQRARINCKKKGLMDVAVYCRRGAAGAVMDLLGISTDGIFLDERPLPAAGQPEVRQYQIRFWDKDQETGPWSDTLTVTVGTVTLRMSRAAGDRLMLTGSQRRFLHQRSAHAPVAEAAAV
jgi:hypothetical protein